MKYFLIEIEKPFLEGKDYRSELTRKIEEGDFDVVSVSETYDQAVKEQNKFVIQNVKDHSMMHYEIIEGDGHRGHDKLMLKIEEFYKNNNLK